jgi:hypothetical protein
MKNHDEVLQQIVRIARSGRDFFLQMYPQVTDPEERTAFTYISDVKSQLIADLAPWVPRIESRRTDNPDPSTVERTSPAAMVEKLYADARKNFRADAPGANALRFGEEQLIKLVERAFEESSVPALKEILKSYYGQLVICREAMWRLQLRLAA